MNMQNKIVLKIFFLFSFFVISSCEEKVSQDDINSYKDIMDIRLGHLGNAIIIQGRLLDAYNLRSDSADENHFKEAEELIKDNLKKFGNPGDLKKLNIPNSTKIKELHKSLIDSSQLLMTAVNMLEDQAWLGGSVSYAENAVDKARFQFQTAVKFIYNPDNVDIKPVKEHKEYDVGEIPEKLLE
tara:strand:- start:3803 stop:4354 length:552 start_codon:yes stop_codon:yes gene_type:complete